MIASESDAWTLENGCRIVEKEKAFDSHPFPTYIISEDFSILFLNSILLT
jgi:hypothetical protein